MCGITGIYCFNERGKPFIKKIYQAVNSLYQRGRDSRGIYTHHNVALGHSRLSIIDISDAASQPFTDDSGRYTVVLNGEFYNYMEFRPGLEKKGYKFRSESDTEVLLNLFIDEGATFINKVNGDFALAIYDTVEESLFLFRDRMGVNPLLYYVDKDKLIFGSEMKALLAFGIPKEIEHASVYAYFQLNYIPAPYTIFKNVNKIIPGEYLYVKGNSVERKKYYSIPYLKDNLSSISYKDAQEKLIGLLDQAVQRRLVSDVPLGAFLSGGVDSSIITALASRHVNRISTFSIGYKDEPYFDETNYARLVAKKYNTNHTVFSLSNDDLYSVLHKVLDYTDEPFADSSALAVYILSMHTREKVTVALSGDGADELFAGYNKHKAHLKVHNAGILEELIKTGHHALKVLPQSRNSSLGNKFRQMNRFAEGMKMTEKDRYWRWCSFANEKQVRNLLPVEKSEQEYADRKARILQKIDNNTPSIYNILYTDMHLVLQGDMLAKVDLMSMANNLEVRVPFLDHTVVDFIFSLPDSYKIEPAIGKKLLQDTFREMLPAELYNRPKHGFEVPLLKWFRYELKSMITDDLLSDRFIAEQNFFNPSEIKKFKNKLFSASPGDIQARIWGLIVFQYWWKKYFA
ncbi:MAG: asparagine synthase (glutamine-hydrolyzing) [Bacteroidia bacterium]|nr:asparagine synthase (glutamine-hydrolyzing) [Bacteroidia bacterium]